MNKYPRALAGVVSAAAVALPAAGTAEAEPVSRFAVPAEQPCTVPVYEHRRDGNNDEVFIRKWSCTKSLGRAGLIKTMHKDVDFYSHRGDTIYTHRESRESVRRYDAHRHQIAGYSSIRTSKPVPSAPPRRAPM